MIQLNIPVGISEFSEIRQREYYYVDKTGLIREMLERPLAKVTLITRPRRFGKTLGMSMLADFFDIRKDSKELFAGLEIGKQPELCGGWMNQYPVIFFSLKDVDGLTFLHAYERLKMLLSDLYKEYTFLLDCEAIDSDDKKKFLLLKDGQADETLVSFALSILMRMLKKYYNKPVILLLDEYDVPVSKASNYSYYPEMLQIIKSMMSTACKDNPCLYFAVITGCLRIAKESIFTGMNNLVVDSISDSRLNEYFGFTQAEVDQILQDADVTEKKEEIRIWYDGYHFGDSDVYCPWDVMNYLRDLQYDPKAKPASYWKNTSDNMVIRSFIDHAGSSITQKMETLLSGGYIVQNIDENLTYDYLHSSEDNLWSILYLTGYLTKVREEDMITPLSAGATALIIPNAEIKEIFETTVIKWFSESAVTWNRQALFDAMWEGDAEAVTQEMSKLLRRTISYHDYKEDFYHAFLAGIFTGAGYLVESNREHGEGRSDVTVFDDVNGRVAIFEVKYSKTRDSMPADCGKALAQIDERMYAKDYEDDYDHILCYGISFFKKRCMVKRRESTN